MRKKGKITSWNDEKGYGFISPSVGGDRIFIHIKAFKNRARRPMIGDVVAYSVSTDARGRPRAENATMPGAPKPAKTGQRSGRLSQVMAFGFLFAVGSAVWASAISWTVLLVYLVVSSATYLAYAFDKLAAKKGNWRTSENTLHLLALGGGWPGALIAQRQLRHKTRKQPFQAIFWVTVVLNFVAFAWLFTPEGADAWHSLVASMT